jgi:heme/copper-type cytochrome/quinol oxidase subunit 2
MKKIKIGVSLLLLSIQSFAFQPNFADTVKSKVLLVTEIAAQTDAANIYKQQFNTYLTISVIEFAVIVLLAILLFRKRATK